MHYINYYNSPLGKILLAASDIGLCGLWFENQKHYAEDLDPIHKEKNLQVFDFAKKWLDTYFSGCKPEYNPDFHFDLYGTPFQIKVWCLLLKIHYGTTATYGEIAEILNTSPRAAANAIAHNHISLIIPCHRVIGSNGKLTGYAGGIEKKEYLLNLEKNGHI